MIEVGGQAVLGRQRAMTTPRLTERQVKNDYDKKKERFLVECLKERFSNKILFVEGIIIKNVGSKVVVNSLMELISEQPEKPFFTKSNNEDKIQYFGAQSDKNT